jgi:hypothetical protein
MQLQVFTVAEWRGDLHVSREFAYIMRLARWIASKHPEFFSGDDAEVQVLIYALHRLSCELDGCMLDGDGKYASGELLEFTRSVINELREGEPADYRSIHPVAAVGRLDAVFTLTCGNGHRLLVLHPRAISKPDALVNALKTFTVKCPVCGTGEIYLTLDGVGIRKVSNGKTTARGGGSG